MKKLSSWLKNIRPLKILTVFLAGIFLFLTQACGAPGIATQPPQPDAQSPYSKRYDPTKDYPLSSPAGGMNNFSDVDPRGRLDEKAANDRADALAKNAQKNIDQKGIDSPEQYGQNYKQGTPLGERVKNLGEDIGSSANEVREGVVKGTQRGIENLKGNTQNAAEDLNKNVQRGAEDVGKNVQRTAEDGGNAVKRTVKDVD
jgi:archaellum component FlaG (FlaF/FlaG flagellin family)